MTYNYSLHVIFPEVQCVMLPKLLPKGRVSNKIVGQLESQIDYYHMKSSVRIDTLQHQHHP